MNIYDWMLDCPLGLKCRMFQINPVPILVIASRSRAGKKPTPLLQEVQWHVNPPILPYTQLSVCLITFLGIPSLIVLTLTSILNVKKAYLDI